LLGKRKNEKREEERGEKKLDAGVLQSPHARQGNRREIQRKKKSDKRRRQEKKRRKGRKGSGERGKTPEGGGGGVVFPAADVGFQRLETDSRGHFEEEIKTTEGIQIFYFEEGF